MYEKIGALYFNYSHNSIMADNKYVIDVANAVSDYKGLNEYISLLSVVNDYKSLDEMFIGSNYDPNSRNLRIDLNIEKPIMQNTKLSYKDRIANYNRNITLTILHELDHALLVKQLDSKIDNLHLEFYKIINANLIENQKIGFLKSLRWFFVYGFSHDKAPIERRANLASIEDFSKVLESINSFSSFQLYIEKMKNKNLKDLVNKSRGGYKIYRNGITNSPSFDYIKGIGLKDELFKINVYDESIKESYLKAFDKYSFIERVFYGLPLSKEEFNEINLESDIFKKYIKTI